MKFITLLALIFACLPLHAQTTELPDSLWSEPIQMSLGVVLKNADKVDFFLLNPDIAYAQAYGLPENITFTRTLDDIYSSASTRGATYYICLTSFIKDGLKAQLEWRKMSMRAKGNTYEISITIHMVFSFVYYYNGTAWSAGPYFIKDREGNVIKTTE